jgi:NodT family efflux transporter outer membrane factor (OMF) lipoprotein
MNFFKKKLKIGILIVLAISLQQCKLYKDPPNTTTLSAESIPESFKIPEYWNANNKDSTQVEENWYTTFNDTHLNNLVNEALDSTNLPILFHLARIDASVARQKLAQTGKSVKVGYSGSYTGSSDTKGTNDYGFVAAGSIAWEADLWGKIKAGILASDENVLSEIYNYNFTKQSITSTVTELYFNIGAGNLAIKIANDFLNLNDTLVGILKVRESVGIINMKDVHLTEGQINTIKNNIEEAKNALQKSVRNLEIILGRYPENKLQVSWVPDSLATISKISDPLSLIHRRPDIKSSESIVKAQFYLSEQARLAKYPGLILSANLGVSSIGALVFGTGASILGPIFNGGAIDAKIAEATAIQKQAAANYGLSIINAFNEVETLMNAELILNKQIVYTKNVIFQTQKAYDIVLKQYEVGEIDLYEVIQLQKQWLTNKLDLVKIENAIYQTRVQLYLALGGNITQ